MALNTVTTTTDRRTTDELERWCSTHFREKEVPALPPTGAAILDKTITIRPISKSPIHNVEYDGVDYVGLTIGFWEDEEASAFHGPLVMGLARFRNGRYQVVSDAGKTAFYDTLPEVQQVLQSFIDGMTADRLAALLAKERRRHPVK